MRFRVVLTATALVLLSVPSTSRALPFGAPELTLWVQPSIPHAGEESTIALEARDPDGAIRFMEICVDGGPCARTYREPGPLEGLSRCVQGDTQYQELGYVFPAPGEYHVVAYTTGDACPGVQQTETSETELTIVVPVPPVLHLDCPADATNNGGATDRGVAATEIALGATVGAGSAYGIHLRDTAAAIRSVADAVNRGGGICGRLIVLETVGDGYRADTGAAYIRNMIAQGSFALLNASSEGLHTAIESGDVDISETPVVSDGTLRDAAEDAWVWPLGPSTASQVHTMASDAYARGARTFGIVYDASFLHGPEAASGLDEAVSHLPGASVKASAGLLATESNYAGEIASFSDDCGCDAVLIALVPVTASRWFANGGPRGTMVTTATSTLGNVDFARACLAQCEGLEVWTGFEPPLGEDPEGAVTTYAQTVRFVSPGADLTNPYTESAYAQMLFLARQIARVGPNLTRAALREALDSASFDEGLSRPLSWIPGEHLANRWTHSFALVYSGDSFLGYRPAADWTEDLWPNG